MVTKPDLAGYESTKSSSGSILENCERRWKLNNPARQVPGQRENEATSGRSRSKGSAKPVGLTLVGARRTKKGFQHVHPVCRFQCRSQFSNL